jgi:hypothetical protein
MTTAFECSLESKLSLCHGDFDKKMEELEAKNQAKLKDMHVI